MRVKLYTTAGQRVEELMLEQNLTTYTLAERAGLNQSTVYRFIYEGIDISSVRLMKICGALNVSMDYVVGLKRRRNG